MPNKNLLLRLLLFASLVFLIVFMIKNDFLVQPKIYNYKYLTISIIFLLVGFIFDSLTWHGIYSKHAGNSAFRYAIIGSGLYIFAKYIPGKFWLLFGRAGYLSDKFNVELNKSIFLVFVYQVVIIIAGTVTGSLLMFCKPSALGITVILISLIILILFIKYINFFVGLFTNIFNRLFKKELTPIKLERNTLVFASLIGITVWFCWNLGFFFLMKSLLNNPEISFFSAFAFSLSAVGGIIAIFAPGGLGIREGALSFLLLFSGLTLSQTTTIALISRLWFLTGELFIFVLAVIFKILDTRNMLSNKI